MIWHIHLGAHKTASTHLQRTLEALNLMPPHREQREASSAIFSKGVPLAELFDKTVLSEENWLGEINEACSFPPYPRLRRNMARLRDATGGSGHAFLSVRHPASFISATYGQALRNTPNKVSLKRTRRAWAGKSPWIGIAETVAEFFPLTIWRYEDYRHNAKAIAELVAGRSIAALPKLPDPPSTMRPTQSAVDAIEASRNLFGRISWHRAQKLLAAGTGPKFKMFDETDAMDEAYRVDIETLKKRGWLFQPR